MDHTHTYDDALRVFASLPEIFAKYQLEYLNLFNTAYGIITQTIQQKSQAGYFANPDFVEHFTVSFAHYYIQAVEQIIENDRELPDAWKRIALLAGQGRVPECVYLLMGANAHINHDLPLALARALPNGFEQRSIFRDVQKVDRILMKCGKDILQSYAEPSRTIDFFKRHAATLYYRPTMYMILYWRIRAWHNYRKILNKGVDKSDYAAFSIKIADRFIASTAVALRQTTV